MKRSLMALILSLSVASSTVLAAGSVQHSGQASKHSVLAVGEGAISTVKVASAVVAVPLVVTGSIVSSVGASSIKTGASNAESAFKPHGGPLVITDTTITADPAPNQVIVIEKKQTVINN